MPVINRQALDMMGALVLDDGRTWAEVAAPFQIEDAEAIFSDEGPRFHYLVRPRSGSKSTDLAGCALIWLTTEAEAGARGYVWAGSRDQAGILLDFASQLVDRTPELRELVTVQAQKLVARNGATVEIKSAEGDTAWGLKMAFAVCDEFAQWPETRKMRKLWTAITSGLHKVPGARFVCLTSAGEPGHHSYRVLQDALKDEKRWHVHQVEGPLPWVDIDDLRAQGLRDSEFDRLHLGIWQASEDRLVSAQDLEAAAVLDGEQDPQSGVRYIIAADLGLVNDRTVVVVAHSEETSDEPGAPRRVIVDSLRRWRGTRRSPVQIADVEAYLTHQARRYNNAKIWCDPWQASGLLQRMNAQGVRCEPFNFTQQSAGRIGQSLHLALHNRLIWLPQDEDLLSELAHVRLRETGIGAARLDHDSGSHDDQAVCLGIVCSELIGNVRTSGAKEWLEALGREQQEQKPTGWNPQQTEPYVPEPPRPGELAVSQMMDHLNEARRQGWVTQDFNDPSQSFGGYDPFQRHHP
jgi:phage terminase large subunit-like protein